jgi:hypothetical protein
MSDRRGPSPEDQAKIDEGMRRIRSAFTAGSAAGLGGSVGRRMVRRSLRGASRFGGGGHARRRGVRLPGLRVLGFGLVIAALSLATCSAGVDLASLTEEYGPPVPASRDEARRFAENTAAALRSAPNDRRIRLEITDAEATSALTLGLMLPELMQAMESMPAEEAQRYDDLGALREHLRARTAGRSDSLPLVARIGAALHPRIRTGDVLVRFTSQGEIVMAGYIQAWRWQQPALVVFAPRARSGELELDFRHGRLGRIPAPEFAFDALGRLAAALILQGRDYAEISEITVEQGRMRFAGTVKR